VLLGTRRSSEEQTGGNDQRGSCWMFDSHFTPLREYFAGVWVGHAVIPQTAVLECEDSLRCPDDRRFRACPLPSGVVLTHGVAFGETELSTRAVVKLGDRLRARHSMDPLRLR